MTDTVVTLLIMDWRQKAQALKSAAADAKAAGDRDRQMEFGTRADALNDCARELETQTNNPTP